MSEENVEVVRGVVDAYNRRDLQGILVHLAPNVELYPSGRFMDTRRVYRGHAGWTEFWNAFQAAWETNAIEIERLEAVGDDVLILARFRMSGRGSGAQVAAEAGWLLTVRSGLVVLIRAFASWEEALKAAGLSE